MASEPQTTSSPIDEPAPRPDPPPETAPEEPPPAPAPEPEPEPECLAPDVERLAPCEGAARYIGDPDGPGRPSPIFLAVVSILTLLSDIGSKLWAEKRLDAYPGVVNVWENHLSFVLAKNRGGAWGLLQGTNENVRRPFFLLVSAAAIAFIVTLYRRLQPRQRALKWGLPLVLGGALGNVFDRIRYGHVIDFIDFRADWLKSANELVAKYVKDHVVTDHWPTFNVADIAICVGVALMALDMFTSKKYKARLREAEPRLIGTLPADGVESADAKPEEPAKVDEAAPEPPPNAEAAAAESKSD
jgi:signal peptidase II